eukprot:5677802-Pyramimonas_sp.AAC.1
MYDYVYDLLSILVTRTTIARRRDMCFAARGVKITHRAVWERYPGVDQPLGWPTNINFPLGFSKGIVQDGD